MSFKLIAEINEDSISLRELFNDFEVSSMEKLVERLDEVSDAAMGRAAERDWVDQTAAQSGKDPVDQRKQEIIQKLGGGASKVQPDVEHLILKDGQYYLVKMVGGSKLNLVNIKTKKAANIEIAKVQQKYTPKKDNNSGRVVWVQK